MLTDHQESVALSAAVLLNRHNRLLIKGSAGVGKTFMVQSLLNMVDPMLVRKVLVTAPTNKAVSVLKSKIKESSKVSLLTTHSALELKMSINNKTGKRTFRPIAKASKWSSLGKVSLLIVDEASMIDSLMLSDIEALSKEHKFAVVFLGDEKQLNPVGEDRSPVFHADYPEVELLEIVRQQKDNPIISLSRNLDRISSGINTQNVDTDDGYVYTRHLPEDVNTTQKIVEKLAEANGTDMLKYLAWTNREVDNMNFMVRKKLYRDPDKIEYGETIIFNSPYKDLHYTNEELLVQHVKIVKEKYNYPNSQDGSLEKGFLPIELSCYVINESVKVIHEDSEKDFKKLKSELFTKAKNGVITFKNYYLFLGLFADIKYNHAITVHKSQGSTYKEVILNVGNIMLNKNPIERQRLLYTGVTRASNLLILHNI